MRNLRIDELSVGSWVQVLHEDRFSGPMRVTGLFDGGGMYIECVGHQGDPFDAKVSEVCPVMMDERSMRGFGFVRVAKGENVWMRSFGDIRLTVSLRYRNGVQECRRAAISGRFACWNEEIRYIHELQRWWTDKVLLPYGVELDMRWREPQTETEELE